VTDRPIILISGSLSHYEILEQLGSCGMG